MQTSSDQGALSRHHEIDRVLKRARRPLVDIGGGDKGLVEKTQDDEDQEHGFVEAGDQLTRLEARDPGLAGGMPRGDAETTHKQQAHRHEEESADADGGKRIVQRQAAQQGKAQGMGAGKKAEDDPALGQQTRDTHWRSG